MALVKCPECGHEVDEAAVACPNCGCPASEWKTPNAADWAADDGFVDYYAILGVSPDATVAQMAQAYRRAALKHHPDRGGSHEDMARVNEAWEVLSDPDKRREYDQLRTQVPDSGDRAGWTEKTEDVRRRAQEYPRQWSDFERWMHKFVDDVAAAEYGESEKIWIATFPTAGRSISGWVFIILGALLGILILPILVALINSHFNSIIPGGTAGFKLRGPMAMMLFLMFAAGGAWLGAKLHQFLKLVIGGEGSAKSRSSTPGMSMEGRRNCKSQDDARNQAVEEQPVMAEIVPQETLRCPACNQSLRVPRLYAQISITCPKCRTKFDHTTHT